MKEAINVLKGKRTYFCATVAILYLVGGWLGFYPVSDDVLKALGFGGLVFLRAAIPGLTGGKLTAEDAKSAEERERRPRVAGVRVPLVLVCCVVTLFAGCATNYTRQKDISYAKGVPIRETETLTKVRTIWESKSALANYKATQSDKTQSTTIGSLSSEASSTNITAQLEVLVKLLQALRPVP